MTDSDPDAPNRSHWTPGELRLLHALSLHPELARLEHHPMTELGLVIPSGDTARCIRLIRLFDEAPQEEADRMADVAAGLMSCTRELVATCLEADTDAFNDAQTRLAETAKLTLEATQALARAAKGSTSGVR